MEKVSATVQVNLETDEAIRLMCLRLVLETGSLHDLKQTTKTAEEYFRYVKNGPEAEFKL